VLPPACFVVAFYADRHQNLAIASKRIERAANSDRPWWGYSWHPASGNLWRWSSRVSQVKGPINPSSQGRGCSAIWCALVMPAGSEGPALRPWGFSSGAGSCRTAKTATRWKSRKAVERALRYLFPVCVPTQFGRPTVRINDCQFALGFESASLRKNRPDASGRYDCSGLYLLLWASACSYLCLTRIIIVCTLDHATGSRWPVRKAADLYNGSAQSIEQQAGARFQLSGSPAGHHPVAEG